mmetsp:Transcript_31429/g.97090  ORF Transcript_31429/g.97090 Transcript_31429/m.97090 type:complete len:225 (+) Transcript_31429:1099-1773(+)
MEALRRVAGRAAQGDGDPHRRHVAAAHVRRRTGDARQRDPAARRADGERHRAVEVRPVRGAAVPRRRRLHRDPDQTGRRPPVPQAAGVAAAPRRPRAARRRAGARRRAWPGRLRHRDERRHERVQRRVRHRAEARRVGAPAVRLRRVVPRRRHALRHRPFLRRHVFLLRRRRRRVPASVRGRHDRLRAHRTAPVALGQRRLRCRRRTRRERAAGGPQRQRRRRR